MNMQYLAPGLYLVPLIQVFNGLNVVVLNTLTVNSPRQISVSEANALAAAAFHDGLVNTGTFSAPAFESEPGLLICPQHPHREPIPASDIPAEIIKVLNGRSANADDLSTYRDVVDAYLAALANSA